MDILHRYLVFDAPILRSSDDEPGIMELVKESICQIIGLYAQRYEEEFKQLPLFVSTIWTLLTNAGLEQRTDGVHIIFVVIGWHIDPQNSLSVKPSIYWLQYRVSKGKVTSLPPKAH